jgi:hypothetical protein
VDLAEWIAAKQAESGLSLRRFAPTIGYSYTQLSRLLTGRRKAHNGDLGRLVDAYPSECERIREMFRESRAA